MKRIVFISMMMVGLLCAGSLAAALDNKEPKIDSKGSPIGSMAPKSEVTGSKIDTGRPKIEVKEMRYDFGNVVKGTKVTHVFEVKNVGNEELIIQKVQPS